MSLTPQQTRVVELVIRGWTDREIAVELRISEQRVDQHIATVARKLPGGSRPRRKILEYYGTRRAG